MGPGEWGQNVDQIKRDFLRDGCVIIPGFLSQSELSELQARTERCMREHMSVWDGPTTKNLQDMDPWFGEQLRRGRQVGLIETLLDDALEPATAAYFDRVPHESGAIPPHFDAIGHRRKGATIWIALDRADQENGCLRYVRGTHRLDLPNRLGLDFDAESEGAIPVELDPGDAAIHNSRTVHWSEPNRSERSRKAISYFYWAESSKGNGKYADFARYVNQPKQARQPV
ncbi:MAG: phytanoyl-CoA dioxygenase family protein [Gammaproteobacteria bacterium]|nr:phytanoyl-CoA dioxygenase family protein [Gammaproteobacteria bacterium]